MWKEAIDSLRLNWISRTSSPLFGALAVSWIVWNHRLLFALFADKDLAWRFAYIDTVLYPTAWQFSAFHIIGPVASALIYLYLFPLPARAVFRHTLNNKRELNEIAQTIEGQRLLTEEDAMQLRKQVVDTEAARSQQAEAFDDEKALLRETNATLARKANDAAKELASAEAQSIHVRPDLAQSRVKKYLLSRPFMHIFESRLSRDKGSKIIVFGESGRILMGKGENEAGWQVSRTGELEFLNDGGLIYSRFILDPEKLSFNGGLIASPATQSLHPAADPNEA